MTDEQKDERRKVITNNKAWETATPVRREYVTELVARRSVPKGTLRYVTEVIMADPAGLAAGNGDGWHRSSARTPTQGGRGTARLRWHLPVTPATPVSPWSSWPKWRHR